MLATKHIRLLLAGAAALAALGLAACSGSRPIRVYVEPTYERDRLEKILQLYPEVKLVAAGREDVSLRVEALPDSPAAPRVRRALVRARERESGYEAYAVAEFLRVRNARGGRARWASSYEGGVREDDVGDIFVEVIREADIHDHADHRHSLDDLLARLHSRSNRNSAD